MPEKETKDTIFAFSTASGGAISVLRLSGARAAEALSALAGETARPREMVLREIKFAGEVIDKGLVVFFPAPHSWTGEDIAELHLHGSRAIERSLISACLALGLRHAEAGEFSKRAFLNGKADLTELEGLADLIAAETEAQRKQALRQMEGSARAIYEAWRKELMSALAQMEAQLDFPEDVESVESSGAPLTLINKVKDEIESALSKPYGERLREGLSLVLLGGANAGKSTLFNLLAGREAAIVSPQAGTTRDVLEIALDIGGYPVVLRDLAGLRTSENAIEQEGVRRALRQAELADLRIILLAPDIPLEENAKALSLCQAGDIVMVNKTDIGSVEGSYEINLSLTNLDESFEKFNKKLIERISELCGGGGVAVSSLITRERHRQALSLCQSALTRAASATGGKDNLELIAEDTRLALRDLGTITGAVGVEDMLGELFSSFCIGK